MSFLISSDNQKNLLPKGDDIYLFLNTFIYLFLAVLGPGCCVWAFFSCSERGLLFVAVRGLLIAVSSLGCGARAVGVRASVVVAHGLQ